MAPRADASKSEESPILTCATLPCGRTIRNRLVKVAMYEHMASFGGGLPNHHHLALYSRWGSAKWGMVLTGNVQVARDHLSLGRDLIVPMENASTQYLEAVSRYAKLADAIKQTGDDGTKACAIIQLSHAGRQSPNILGGRPPWKSPLAPSNERVGAQIKTSWAANVMNRLLFSTPTAMSIEAINSTKRAFIRGAKLALESGFDGIQLHGAHGYLLTQFMNPLLNRRSDAYSDGLLLMNEIVQGIHQITPPSFVVGVKFNAADYSGSGITEDLAISQLLAISRWNIDFIEISGGDYERPEFMSSSPRQLFFQKFSAHAMRLLHGHRLNAQPLIVLTGGFRNLIQWRLSILIPDFPSRVSSDRSSLLSAPQEPRLVTPSWVPKLVGGSVQMAWYAVAMRAIAVHRRPNYSLGSIMALIFMWFWIATQSQ